MAAQQKDGIGAEGTGGEQEGKTIEVLPALLLTHDLEVGVDVVAHTAAIAQDTDGTRSTMYGSYQETGDKGHDGVAAQDDQEWEQPDAGVGVACDQARAKRGTPDERLNGRGTMLDPG